MKPPVSTEFARVLRETNLGKPLDRALTEMDRRVGSPDFSLIVTAVLIQQQVGGNLADIIDIIRDTILDRIRLRGEIKTLTAQGAYGRHDPCRSSDRDGALHVHHVAGIYAPAPHDTHRSDRDRCRPRDGSHRLLHHFIRS